jgi:hypothetical protein
MLNLSFLLGVVLPPGRVRLTVLAGIVLHQAEEKVRSFLRFLLLPRAFVVETPQRLTRPERHRRYTD